jgi:alpha-ketoglutarate-dependent dioxygenase FTO
MDSFSKKHDLKKESAYGMGKVSVGWHRDSGLKDFSSIAVYQSLQGVAKSATLDGWGVALRAMDGGAGGPLTNVPALCVPLPSGSLYYMLDEFNHNHEHAVVAGSSGVRFSSTHRVARDGQGTWQSIRDKSDQFLVLAKNFDFSTGAIVKKESTSKQSSKKSKDFASIVRAQQMLMNEIEFEWLRQWFVQGQRHKSLHNYWHTPIEKLCATFCKLEKAAASTLRLLQSQSTTEDKQISEQLYDVFIECLSERSKLRAAWTERYNDPVFETIPPDERPMKCPCLDRDENNGLDACLKAGQIPESIDKLVEEIREWRSAFVESKQNGGDKSKTASAITKKRKKSGAASLTRKEQKRVASNWEMLKRKM